MTADPIALARDLIRCPSVTPAEGGALALIERVLSDAGFEVHRVTFTEPGTDPVDNLYARIGTAAPHLMLTGHTDVVPPGDENAMDASALRERDCRRRAVRPRRGRHEGRDRLQDCGRARLSRGARRQAERLALVSHHRRRGRHRGQRHREAVAMGGGARREIRPRHSGRADQSAKAWRHDQDRPARLAERHAGRNRHARARRVSGTRRQSGARGSRRSWVR